MIRSIHDRDKIVLPGAHGEGLSVDYQAEEDVVLSLQGELMSSQQLRRLTRYVCRTPERVGWEELVAELDKGAPSYPIIDELVELCVYRIRRALAVGTTDVITEPLTIDFYSPSVDKEIVVGIMRELEKILRGDRHTMHLSLLTSRSDQDIHATVVALIELYEQLGQQNAIIATA